MSRISETASYFAFLAFSALNFAHRALVAFEILALAAADIVRFRLTLLVTISLPDEAVCEPFKAAIPIWIPLS